MVNFLGYVASVVAIVGFGSNFIPIKRYETGDGVYFQWVMCTAIWISGFVVNIVMGCPKFQPLACLGGVIWCTGNMMVVPCVKTVGLALGLLIWGMTALLTGWFTGHFGLFGLNKQTANVHHPVLNYVGVAIACVATMLYILVKSEPQKVIQDNDVEGRDLAQENIGNTNIQGGEKEPLVEKEPNHAEISTSWVDKLTVNQKRVIGVILSLLSGLFYGSNFDPPQYILDHPTDDYKPTALDLVFSHFSGIYVTSTFYFLIYCLVMKNKPKIYPEVTFPSFLSGVIWAIADIAWFVANSKLSFVVSFPLIATGPGIVGSLWGIFVFGEIRGGKNYSVLGGAFLVTAISMVFIVLSSINDL